MTTKVDMRSLQEGTMFWTNDAHPLVIMIIDNLGIIILITVNCSRPIYKRIRIRAVNIGNLLIRTPWANALSRKMIIGLLPKLPMFRTNDTDLLMVAFVYSLGIIILLTMHFSCIGNKFFYRLFAWHSWQDAGIIYFRVAIKSITSFASSWNHSPLSLLSPNAL